MSYANEEIEVLKHDDFCKEKLHFEGLCIDKFKRIVESFRDGTVSARIGYGVALKKKFGTGLNFHVVSFWDYRGKLSPHISE